jgi:hypothetical protein
LYGVLNAWFESPYSEINTIFTYLTLSGGLAVILPVIHIGTGLLVRGFSPNWDFPWICIFVRQCSIWLRCYYSTEECLPPTEALEFGRVKKWCLMSYPRFEKFVTCWEPGFDPGHEYQIFSRRWSRRGGAQRPVMRANET